LRPILDKEAERLGKEALDAAYELFQLPLSVIPLSSQRRLNAFQGAANTLGISTIGELTGVSWTQLVVKARLSPGCVKEIERWLQDRGLTLAQESG